MQGPPRLTVLHQVQEAYFGSTYVDGVCNRNIKEKVNQAVRLAQVSPSERPDQKSSSRVSALLAHWRSVYRSLSAYVASLKGKYH